MKRSALLAGLCVCIQTGAQILPAKKTAKDMAIDSLRASQWRDPAENDLPVTALNENERSESQVAFMPSLLTASRDVFMNTASFHFNIVRFRMRGYEGSAFNTQVNGIPMNNPDDGNTQWGLWGGLNDVTRNTQITLGLRASEYAFGNIGSAVHMDMRASRQRLQTQFGYSFSNRSYAHRWMFTHTMAMNKKGWAFSFSGSWRYAAEGYVAGTSYRGGSYFAAVDKRLRGEHLLSLMIFGASVLNGKQSPVLEESAALAHNRLYNAYWGYQSGRKRNANMGRAHQPVILFSHEHRLSNHTSWTSSASFITGEKSSTAPDWYKAPDPRPDYYRYLPSYQQDPVLRLVLAETISQQGSLRQVDWDKLYAVNRNSPETVSDVDGIAGNTVFGLRSHYIIEERVAAVKRIVLNSVYHTLLKSGLAFTAGASLLWQQSHYFKRIDDLLGGDYYVDWNQFADDVAGDQAGKQHDLNHANRVIRRGDTYGYNYKVETNMAKAWVQLVRTKKQVDLFAALEGSYTNYLRDGLARTGLFPYQSFGRSELNEFGNYAAKAGITYKINGRKYLYLHTAILTKAPLFDNVYISPRTRDSRQEAIVSEKILSAEAGYIYNSPAAKIRFTGYLSHFSDGMNVTTFYHDAYRSFMNYVLHGIDKMHAGTELGAEIRLSSRYTLIAAAAIGRQYYTGRQQVTVTADNDAYVAERDVIYSKHFRVAGGPQEAYSLGINWQAGYWYGNLSANYFRQHWLEFNPLRRTYGALEGVVPGTEQWDKIIRQTMLPDQYTADLSAGGSLRMRLPGSTLKRTISIYLSINNLLNQRQLISGGYEQLRFDTVTKNIARFPAKFFYAMGLNFSVNINLRL